MDEVITVKNLTKIYTIYDKPTERLKEALGVSRKKLGKEFYALEDINFTVKKGRTLGIIGENGAGKSTLLKILTGVLAPTSGDISINGKISALLELGIGFNIEYTGIENIYLSGDVNGLTRSEMELKVNDILEFADIGDFIYQKVKTYSSGMFARLAFAVAINIKPEILIVDEALSVGDLFFQQKCNLYMKEKMKDCTKLLVTHDMASIANMADEVIVISKGRQVFWGDPLQAIEFYTKKTHTELFRQNNKSEVVKQEEIETLIYESTIIDFKDWSIIEFDALGGALDAKILAHRISINGKPYIGYVQDEDDILVEILIESSKNIDRMIIGYQVKDKYGNVIFGENTHSSGFPEHKILYGKKYVASINFRWPKIQKGNYFLTLGIGEGNHEMQHIIQCWAHNIFEITNVTNRPNHGLFNNEIEKFNVKEVE